MINKATGKPFGISNGKLQISNSVSSGGEEYERNSRRKKLIAKLGKKRGQAGFCNLFAAHRAIEKLPAPFSPLGRL